MARDVGPIASGVRQLTPSWTCPKRDAVVTLELCPALFHRRYLCEPGGVK